MDMNQPLEPVKWNAFEPGAELPRSGKPPKQAEAYVTWDEMRKFQRNMYELMRLFLEFHVGSAIEMENPYLNIHLN